MAQAHPPGTEVIPSSPHVSVWGVAPSCWEVGGGLRWEAVLVLCPPAHPLAHLKNTHFPQIHNLLWLQHLCSQHQPSTATLYYCATFLSTLLFKIKWCYLISLWPKDWKKRSLSSWGSELWRLGPNPGMHRHLGCGGMSPSQEKHSSFLGIHRGWAGVKTVALPRPPVCLLSGLPWTWKDWVVGIEGWLSQVGVCTLRGSRASLAGGRS